MKTIKITGILTCLQPLYHGGDEKTGSETLLRRQYFRVGNDITAVPIVSGNAIRGILRRLIFKDLMDSVELTDPTIKQIHTYLSGGILESVAEKESGRLDIEARKKFSKIPPIALFGFSFANQIFDGKMKVAQALPICKELAEFTLIESEKSVFEFLDFQHFTRKDEVRDRQEDEAAVQMMVRNEIFVPGTQFSHSFVLEDTNDLEDSCFAYLLDLFIQRPYLGGKSSVGYGEVQLNYQHNFSKNAYVSHIKEKKDEIRETLELIQ